MNENVGSSDFKTGIKVRDFVGKRHSMEFMSKPEISGSIVKPNNPLLLSSNESEKYTPLAVAYSIASHKDYNKEIRNQMIHEEMIEIGSSQEHPPKVAEGN